jgi:hypothetical protein
MMKLSRTFPLLMLVFVVTGCSSDGAKGPPMASLDREMLADSAAAQQAFARGAYDQAADQYRRALARARLQDEPAFIGDQSYNLAICLIASGQIEEARDRLIESEAAMRKANLPLADVLLVAARLAYRRADKADDAQSRPVEAHRIQVALLRAEIACDRGDATMGSEQLAQARALPGIAAPGLGAGASRIAARLQSLRGEPLAAAQSYDEEARLQRQVHRYPDMAKALLNAAAAYAKASQPALAADRAYRAAASLWAREKAAEALAALDSAATWATAADDAAQGRLIEALRADIKRTTK